LRILEFSGGKDSLAVLLLLKDELKDITVLWADSGDSFPETYAQMELVKKICPNFITVNGFQKEVIRDFGYPVDVLPVSCHTSCKDLHGERPKLQGYSECCVRSFIMPLHNAAIQLGATEIIRGQKASDSMKSNVKNGDIVDGIRYNFPIEDWTDAQVMEYVKDSELLPKHYKVANTGLDCMHCTAYLAENTWKLQYLIENHPIVAKEVSRRFKIIKNEIDKEMKHLNEILDI